MWKFLLFIAAVIVWPGWAQGENVAFDKPAFQTSTNPTLGAAGNAVDGNTNTDYFAGYCASTLEDSNPAWWVDLGQTHIIDRVDIFNRQDCCGDKISPFNIHIGDSPRVSENHKCGGDHQMDAHQPATSVSCYGMKGRYVGIRLPGLFRTLTLCEVQISGEIDECASSPCVHGTCFDAIDGYSCFCEPGWGGDDCDTNTDDCRSSPCIHGTCSDVVGGYTCSCENGWEGTNCDQDINECASSPCVHGYCSDGVNSYTCTCDQTWSGTNCDQDFDWCNPNPCPNDLLCVNLGNHFHCAPRSNGRRVQHKCSSASCPDDMYCTPEDVGGYSCKLQ